MYSSEYTQYFNKQVCIIVTTEDKVYKICKKIFFIIINMNSYQLAFFLALVVILNAGPWKNNTGFWKNKLNLSEINFQAYSGYEEIDWYYPHNSSGMFYTLFSAADHVVTTDDDKVPLLIWLQGGPGASSQFGAFTEIGPIRIQKGNVKSFEYSWNTQGHYLFIDSPLNVGFSYQGDRMGTSQVSQTWQAVRHLLNFLSNFYKQWPALKSSPLYITGQSFAGHYVPLLASYIISNMTFRQSTGISLAGIAIGDGWTDPINQVNFYDSYLYSVGIISNKFRDTCTWFQTNSIINMMDSHYKNATMYFDFLTNNDTTPEAYFGNISMFNFRNYYGIDQSFAKFLNDNRAQFGASVEYIPGNDNIYSAFAQDITKSYANHVITCLRNVKVLIYNGQNDVVVNTAGVLQYLNNLNWQGLLQWKRAQKKIWTISGEVNGWAKTSGNLWFVLVNGAGHMVPFDKPKAAHNMIEHFIKGNHQWKG